jgi:hypothetical protein
MVIRPSTAVYPLVKLPLRSAIAHYVVWRVLDRLRASYAERVDGGFVGDLCTTIFPPSSWNRSAGPMARRLTTNQEIAGSIPASINHPFVFPKVLSFSTTARAIVTARVYYFLVNGLTSYLLYLSAFRRSKVDKELLRPTTLLSTHENMMTIRSATGCRDVAK